MTLPKFTRPTFEILVPSKGTKFLFRPFLTMEEKILLIAQEGDDERDMVRALTQVVSNCSQSDLDISSLTLFDLEYLFIKLRAQSVNNFVELQYRDNDDEQIYTFNVDLADVNMVEDPEHTKTIEVDDNGSLIVMKYPSVVMTDTMPVIESPVELMDYMILSCIDKVWHDDEEYVFSEASPEEQKEFLDNLDIQVYNKLRVFFETMPKLYYKLTYINKNEQVREIELTSIRDFFTWG